MIDKITKNFNKVQIVPSCITNIAMNIQFKEKENDLKIPQNTIFSKTKAQVLLNVPFLDIIL